MALSEETLKELKKIHTSMVGDTIGVLQAIDLLTKALKAVEAEVKAENYERASHLGYTQVAQEFIFLQRVLGCLQSDEMNKCKVIQDLAFERKRPYEEVAPEVEEAMKSFER